VCADACLRALPRLRCSFGVTVASWDAATAADDAAGAAADAQAPPSGAAGGGALAPYVALALRTAGAGGAAATHHLKLTLLEFRVRRAAHSETFTAPHIQRRGANDVSHVCVRVRRSWRRR
jgi:hypothetical protein